MMKRLLQIIFAVIVVTQTATVATAEEKKAPLKYVDALDFRMINKGFMIRKRLIQDCRNICRTVCVQIFGTDSNAAVDLVSGSQQTQHG